MTIEITMPVTPRSSLRDRLEAVMVVADMLNVSYTDIVAYGILIDLEMDVAEINADGGMNVLDDAEEPVTLQDLIGNRADDMHDDMGDYIDAHIADLTSLNERLNAEAQS